MKTHQQHINARIIARQNYAAAAIIGVKFLILIVSAAAMLVVMSSALEAVTSIGAVLDQAQKLKGF